MKLVTQFFLSIFSFLFLFISCNDYSDKKTIRKYYSNGHIMSECQIEKEKKEGFEINYYINGKVKSVLNYFNDKLDGEQFYYYENGFLREKEIMKQGVANGNAYYFYKNGAIKALRYFNNGREVIYGEDYWNDSVPTIKSILHFNDSGQIYYKKNFDSLGVFFNEEGHRAPHKK